MTSTKIQWISTKKLKKKKKKDGILLGSDPLIFCTFWHRLNKTFSLDFVLKCQPWDNEMMHIPKLYAPNSKLFINVMAFLQRKESRRESKTNTNWKRTKK